MKTFLTLLSLLLFAGISRADIPDPFDPFEKYNFDITIDEQGDKEKSAKQLILEATVLLDEERLLDARTKLLRALQKDPNDYKAHLMLSAYYLDHVGHFRLSLKYVKRALELFYRANGYPPYKEIGIRLAHQQLLYLLSQVRLNIDDYEGSLKALDEFTSYGYTSPWYWGSRAWVLMKLGHIEEAIRAAREGVRNSSEPGRTLNMLGILLSMHGEREASLQVFREAIAYELSMGQLGQPATPLNNSGEVYKEIFREDDAERAWLRATSLPDGCEHVLPSLNLALIYFDALNLSGAKRAMDSFEACIAQYPLRNGEEHKALVALARGRTALLAGHPDEALQYLNDAMQKRQWFGKIGTSMEDLEAALFMSLGQAYLRQNNHLATARYESFSSYLDSLRLRLHNQIRSWWYFRKARQVLAEDLNDIEDLYIRNTDSLLEYPTLGELLSGYPRTLVEKRMNNLLQEDPREHAKVFYEAYLAEKYLKDGYREKGLSLVREVIGKMRLPQDALLYVHSLALLLKELDPDIGEYGTLAQKVLSLSPAALRNYGLLLPVNISSTEGIDLERALKGTAFYPEKRRDLPFLVRANKTDKGFQLSFKSQDPKIEDRVVTGDGLKEGVNKLSDAVFSETVN